jgi:hypothetical protein
VPYCPNCGKAIFAEEKFCHHCSQKINISTAQHTATEIPFSTAPKIDIPIQKQQILQTQLSQPPAPHIQPPTVQRGNASPAQVPHNQPGWVKDGIRGTVRGVRKDILIFGVGNRREERELTFRLEQIDDVGNIIEIIPSSAKFSMNQTTGMINDGDTVVVLGSRDSSGLFVARKLYNESTNCEFNLKQNPVSLVLVLLVLIAIGFFLFFILLTH